MSEKEIEYQELENMGVCAKTKSSCVYYFICDQLENTLSLKVQKRFVVCYAVSHA